MTEETIHARPSPGLFLAPTPTLLPGRSHRRESDAVGAAARRQGLLWDGPAPARSAGDALHHQPGAKPVAATASVHRARRHRPTPPGVAPPRGRPDRNGLPISARQLF